MMERYPLITTRRRERERRIDPDHDIKGVDDRDVREEANARRKAIKDEETEK